MSGPLQIPDFLDAATCQRLRQAMRVQPAAPAGLLGSASPRPEVRRAAQVALDDAEIAPFEAALAAALPRLSAHFDVVLNRWEPPQALRYGAGDYFVAHQDGNTPLVFDASRHRRVSVILFLSPQTQPSRAGGYGEGWLTLHEPWPRTGRQRLAPPPGTLLAFRSETTHEVEPVAHGERLTIVSWCA